MVVIPNQFFYYDTLSLVKSKMFKGCLAITDIVGNLVHWEELKSAEGGTVFNFWGYTFEKEKVRYCLPTIIFENGLKAHELDINEILPLRVNNRGSTKVSYQGKAYELINNYTTIKITQKNTISFRDLVDRLACFQHENPEHYKLYWLIVLTQLLDRANFRIATPAGFGKDSAVDISNALMLNCGTVENPTIAKLEERAYRLKLLVVNEVVDITKDNWRQIEQFLLATGAHKNEVTKRSRAHGGVDEVINISKLSLTLMYNDIDHYSNPDNYIDNVSKHAVLDRFPPLRLHGRLKENFNSLKNIDIHKLAEDHIVEYKEMVANLIYYRENLFKHAVAYDDTKLIDLPERWKINVTRLLKTISCYVKDQEEYDYWIGVVNGAMNDYEAMKSYSSSIEKFKKKSTQEKINQEIKHMKATCKTFIERNKYLDELIYGKAPVKPEEWTL